MEDQFEQTAFNGKRIASAKFDPDPDFNILTLAFEDGTSVKIVAIGGHGGCGMLSFQRGIPDAGQAAS